MSVHRSTQLHCPHCDHTWVGPLPVSVNPERHREAPLQLRNRSLWVRTCPACQAPVAFDMPFTWTDFARLHFVLVRPAAEDLHTLLALEKQAKTMLYQTVAGHPRAIEDRALCFRVRVVSGAERLREKLLLWSAGIDDALVEVLKLAAVRDRPALRQPDMELVVVEVGDLLHTQVWQAGRPVGRLALRRDRLDELRAVRALLIDDFGPLFTGGWVDIRRTQLWATATGSPTIRSAKRSKSSAFIGPR